MITIDTRFSETKIVRLKATTDSHSTIPDYEPPAGWVIVAMWSEPYDEPWSTPSSYHPLRRTRPCVMLGRNYDQVLDDLRKRNEELDKQLRFAQSAGDVANRHARTLEAQRDEALVTVARLQDLIEVRSEQHEVQAEKFRKLEGDLAKLREALGSKQIDSILNPNA